MCSENHMHFLIRLHVNRMSFLMTYPEHHRNQLIPRSACHTSFLKTSSVNYTN